jgi:hypothetical protein
VVLGQIWVVLGKTWEVLGKTWEVLGKTWEVLGKTWEGQVKWEGVALVVVQGLEVTLENQTTLMDHLVSLETT